LGGVKHLHALLLAISCATGCASSVLIARDDASFANAQRRLLATSERVAATDTSPAERTLFLQAEGFYRYRFQPPRRLLLSYLAEGAAAIVDFPALQAVAGAIDMAELRMRMYDGSVQLWETLLERHPRTALRPLTLYRLGWAYRTAGASGFPRESGQQAFAALLQESPGSPLATLARAAEGVPWKSKDTATALSVLPGLGQIYVGESLNGAVRIAIAVASLALVAVPAVVAYQRREELSWSNDWPLVVTGVGGLVLLSLDYTAAYRDALRGVMEFNERGELAFEQRHPEAP
jgi:hypothetical protein